MTAHVLPEVVSFVLLLVSILLLLSIIKAVSLVSDHVKLVIKVIPLLFRLWVRSDKLFDIFMTRVHDQLLGLLNGESPGLAVNVIYDDLIKILHIIIEPIIVQAI